MLKEQIVYYRQHWFIKNVATLQAGTFAGTIFQAVVGILMARLLQPELFGIYALSFSLAAIVSILFGAGINEAVSTLLSSAYARKDEKDVYYALGFLLKITFYAGLVTLFVLFFLPMISSKFYGSALIGVYAAMVVFASLVSCTFFSIVQLSLQVTSKIKQLTYIIFSDQLIRFGLSLAFVLLGFGIPGAVLGHLLGAGIMAFISIMIWEKLRREEPIFPSLRKLIFDLRSVHLSTHFNFVFWTALDRNMGSIYMSLPVLLVGLFVIAEQVSFFKLSFGYLNLALSLLGPVSILLNMEFPKMLVESREKLAGNFKKVSMYGLGLSALLTAGAVLVSPFAFRILYGESFMPSVNYVYLFSLYGLLFGIGVGLGPMWRAINKVKISIFINTIILGIGIPSGIFLINLWGITGAVIMVTLWFTVSHMASYLYILRELKKKTP
jgi:O-antigen/teichoic acid export membrane protein